jgi:hypothetical protein
MEKIFTELREGLARHGLNLVGATSAARYDTVVPPRWTIGSHAPDVRSVLVIGNGGAGFWKAFRRRVAVVCRDPLDAFTRAVVTDAVTRGTSGDAPGPPNNLADPAGRQPPVGGGQPTQPDPRAPRNPRARSAARPASSCFKNTYTRRQPSTARSRAAQAASSSAA